MESMEKSAAFKELRWALKLTTAVRRASWNAMSRRQPNVGS